MKAVGISLVVVAVFLTNAFSSDELSLELPRKPINRHLPLGESSALFPGSAPIVKALSDLPAMFSPNRPRYTYTRYPWKNDIVTTVFWAGEKATVNNPVPNTASSWDPKWSESFGGYDDPDPDARKGYLPKKFVPKQNPFYVALPYNDTMSGSKTKSSARKYIPWYEETFYREGRSIVKGRWVAIRLGDKICYGQWEDCGPFETDNYEYVFGNQRPRTTGNKGAGLDVSPAIRDYLGFRYSSKCDWRFVELYEIHDGPWKKWGNNNPFVLRSSKSSGEDGVSESIVKLREMRKQFLKEKEE
ncbi:MAG: hypothetical protein P1U89_02375 [Verrucomicrobiales bacterium]|nr:hypothetical protein [Verrucomicrobiales bacterium]